MPRNAYRRPAEEVNMAEEERGIRRGSTIALIVTIVAFAGAYTLAPWVARMPTALAERLAFAALCWAVVAFTLLVAILMVSTTRRFSPADIGGQAAGPPSGRLAIRSAFLQNTLEQTVLAAGFFFALAAVAGGAWLGLLPAAVILFVAGRILFYAGYDRGAKGRALGMALTMLPSVLGYPIVAVLAFLGG